MTDHHSCKHRNEFTKEDIEILGSITPKIRNGEYKADCDLHVKIAWPHIFCEEIREAGLCPEGYL